jgi:dTDP-4-amino-4,6-dideoxygalactose transaminase
VHLLPAYADLGYHSGDFPQAETMAAEELSLPMYPELSKEAIHRVAAALIEALPNRTETQTKGAS